VSPDFIDKMASTTELVGPDTTVAVDLTLHTSSPNRDHSQDKENCAPFYQSMADRIKERSRKAATTNHIAPATTTMEAQQTPSLSPQKSRTLKRPAAQATAKKSARRQKVFEDEDNEICEDTSATALPTMTTTSEQATSKKLPHGQKVFEDEGTEVRLDTTATALPTPTISDVRPLNNSAGNRDFAEQVIKALKRKLNSPATCFGDRQNERIHYLLTNASPANDEEMLFLSGDEAAAKLRPRVFHDGPILTEGQQPLRLQTVQEFLDEYYDDDTMVWIQDPSVTYASMNLSVREVPVGKVKNRLLGGKKKCRPWNCLELATHVEDGLRPTFLAGEDTRLLTKLKLDQATEYAGRRSYPQGYKEVEKWALLAEAGALTEPHQDSHGYSTYITANQGRIGFGWLSYPTDDERVQWTEDPESIPGDRYRYVVLVPGQTVYFPAGTVHFVFRLQSAGHTLAFGGHVLRCSNIVHWAKTMLEERSNPQITNEDLTSSAPGYLNRVEKFVLQAQNNGSLEKWGGVEEVEEFLRLKEQFMETWSSSDIDVC
jgi:hypothetical protein